MRIHHAHKHYPTSPRAPRESVAHLSRAFLDADAMADWPPPCGFTCRVHHMDAKVSGTQKTPLIDFTMRRGHSFGGEYPERVPFGNIRYTDRCDDPNLPGKMQTTKVSERGAGIPENSGGLGRKSTDAGPAIGLGKASPGARNTGKGRGYTSNRGHGHRNRQDHSGDVVPTGRATEVRDQRALARRARTSRDAGDRTWDEMQPGIRQSVSQMACRHRRHRRRDRAPAIEIRERILLTCYLHQKAHRCRALVDRAHHRKGTTRCSNMTYRRSRIADLSPEGTRDLTGHDSRRPGDDCLTEALTAAWGRTWPTVRGNSSPLSGRSIRVAPNAVASRRRHEALTNCKED